MSETPRTDAVIICNTYTKTDTVGAWFARALERELAAMTAERDRLRERVRRLEEAGDSLLAAMLTPESEDYSSWACKQADARNGWTAAREAHP